MRRYPPKLKERAVARALEVGNSQAAEELGIPKGTVDGWRAARKRQRQAKERSGDDAPPTPTDEPTPLDGHSNKVARTYTPSERARALELAAQVGVSRAARELGITRFSIYAWRRKARQFAEGKSGENPLVGSDEDPAKERDRRILEVWKAHPGLGPSQVRNQLRRAGFKVSVHTVRRVMEDDGYLPPKVRKRTVHDQRYEAVRPNQLWHLDFVHRYVNKLHIYILLLLDDYSRFIVGAEIWEGERVDRVIETFESAVSRHGRPEMAMSDGGSAFWAWRGVSRFTRVLDEMGIDQWIAKVPQVNGKLEVLNANLAKELFNQERFFDLGQTQQRLVAWREFYNFRRTHHGLGGLLVPADRYFGRAEAVLARIEAGGTPDGIGEPLAVGERHLDLLRVSSKGGQMELYLMGQRLWPAAPMR